jgi:hypothetical protein
MPNFFEDSLRVIFSFIKDLFHFVVPLFEHPILVDESLGPFAEFFLVILDDFFMLFKFFLCDLSIQFDMINILLLCSQGLDNLKHAFQGFDDMLDTGAAESLRFFIGLKVGIEMRGREIFAERGFDGIDEFPVVGNFVERRDYLDSTLFSLHPFVNLKVKLKEYIM